MNVIVGELINSEVNVREKLIHANFVVVFLN